jgi:ribosomal-protein-alanine N-acetyltransferase
MKLKKIKPKIPKEFWNEISTERLILRKPNLKDVDDLVENGNEKELSYLTYYLPYPFDKEEAEKIISENDVNGELIRFAIVLKKDKKLIGLIDLYNWKRSQHIVKIGYWVGKNYRKQGYVSEIMPKIIEFAFEKLNVEKITAKVLIDNIASQKLLEKFNFVKTKVTPGDKFLDGKRVDTISYELARKDY